MSTFDSKENQSVTRDMGRDIITRHEFERFRYSIDKEISKLKEKHYEDKEKMLIEINESRISNVRIEESFKSISEAVQGIQVGVNKISDKVDVLGNEVSDNSTQLLSLDKKVALMEQSSTPLEKEIIKKSKDHVEDEPDEVNSNRTKIIMALFTFLGVAVPALLAKADVILDFILKIKGK